MPSFSALYCTHGQNSDSARANAALCRTNEEVWPGKLSADGWWLTYAACGLHCARQESEPLSSSDRVNRRGPAVRAASPARVIPYCAPRRRLTHGGGSNKAQRSRPLQLAGEGEDYTVSGTGNLLRTCLRTRTRGRVVVLEYRTKAIGTGTGSGEATASCWGLPIPTKF